MIYRTWLIFIGAAILEVGADAIVRKGLRGHSVVIIMIGCAMLGSYGIVVNTVKLDFSKLLGVYVAFFALISILFGRFVFKEKYTKYNLDRIDDYYLWCNDNPVRQ